MADQNDELRDVLRWVRHALHRHISRNAHRLVQTGGRLNDLFVSLDEARRTLPDDGRPRPVDLPQPPPPSPLPVGPRLSALAERFGLDEMDLRLLAVAAAPALDVELSRLYPFAWADFTHKQPSVGFLCELVAPGEPLLAQAALRDARPLVRERLLRLMPTTAWGPEPPRLHLGVTVPDPVVSWLKGEPSSLLARLGEAARLHRPETAPAELYVSAGVAEALDRIFARAPTDEPTVMMLVGAPTSGRRSALHAAAARTSRSLLHVDLDRLAASGSAASVGEAMLDTLREARMRGAVPALAGDDLFEDSEKSTALLPLLRLAVGRFPGPVALIARQPLGGALTGLEPIELRLEPLDSATQVALWRRVLGEDADAALAESLAERFSMPAGAICAAAESARIQSRFAADPGVGPDGAAVTRAVRTRISHALDAVAEQVGTTLTWDDVVLPDDVMETLREIRAQARHRSRVYDTWGFRRKVAYGRGLACLFAGPPGTGKTMMATILAADLGRELYRVDLSRVVSKWVGETEKNLSRVFDEAERAQIILFFDEADSLFSSRTEVKGANDRFANMEVNYLLQRMENFDGMSILTTNFERGIDEAFKRRLKFKVQFPLPDADQRAALWERCVPAAMPIDEGIRWSLLGRKYKLSGGNIKNAVVRAAFYAAEGEGRLTEKLLQRAADAETREMGRL